MKNERLRVLIFGAWALCLLGFAALPGDPVPLRYPENWPAPAYDFSRNPLTRQGIELGRRLFYDPVLSRDSTVSCSTCHLSYTAFAHVDHALSHGIGDRIGRRNAPALMNLAWAPQLMWDGAVNHLDVQALAPIQHPDEMGETLAHVLQKIQTRAPYPRLFREAFGDSTATGERLLKALSQFELTLLSDRSKYDRVRAGTDTFSRQEQQGYQLFRQHCARCHEEPFFTNFSFENNGLPLDTALRDLGRMALTGRAADSLKFKVPSLRNLEFSYPYMHDGRFRHLREVLRHYTQATGPGFPIPLSATEKVDLNAFLLTLTDRAFLFDPAFGFPRE